MVKIEFPEELQKQIEAAGPPDLVIGVDGPADIAELRAKVIDCLLGIAAGPETAPKIILAHAGAPETNHEISAEHGILFAAYPIPAQSAAVAPWLSGPVTQRSVLALAAAWQARACLVVHSDLAALNAETVRLLTEPVLQGQNDLVVPSYPTGKYDALINKSLLAPLSRALYGRRVRVPLPFDFCAGSKVLSLLSEENNRRVQDEPDLLWSANIVAMQSSQNGSPIGQAFVNIHHHIQTEGLELSAVLTELAGSLFQQAESYAASWQRVRGSQPVTRYGQPFTPAEDTQQPVDPVPMIESFLLASRSLEEVWRLLLPPASMLELKRLTRLDPAQFRMPDALWARIVYDFALAYRLRRISRAHVLGALTPLYLGWVASYTQEIATASAAEADQRSEQLARAYEEQKPYFVSRWRWPERLA